jgi:phage terminase large subunit GpA-like protein
MSDFTALLDGPSAAEIVADAARSGARPDPQLLVSEWAGRYRILTTRSSPEPGPWSTDRTPFLRAIMDDLSPRSRAEMVVFMKGSQIGGTECGNNWIGFNIHHAPGPMMAVQPTTEMAKRNSKQRIGPLIEDTPALRNLVKDPRSRDSGNTVLAKEFPGGILVMVGANSAAGLRSMSARYLFLDEVDGYPGDVEGEGEPCDLAIARTTNYARRKIFITSTPVVSGRSRIERFFETSDQRYYYVPCPFCAMMQTLRFENLRWPKYDPSAASYHCEGCGRSIPNHAKNYMLPRGEWRAHAVNDGKIHGYHLSSLYSPVGWLSWGQIAEKYEKALKDREKLQVFHNTVLGIPWMDTGEVPDTDRLYERKENYPIGTVPRGGLLLTAGADVQRTRVEVEVVAWGRNKHSWSVDYRVFEGDTNQPAVWQHVAAMLDEDFPTEYGAPMRIQRLAVDSGFNTMAVYDFVRGMSPQRVMAIKGDSRVSALVGVPSLVEVGPAGRRIRYGIRLWPLNTSIAKEELYRWLRTAVPDLAKGEAWPTGFCHFPAYSKEYFEQLTAEQLVTRTHGGLRRAVWEKRRDRNEALDCRIYARAAAGALRFETWSPAKWDELEAALLSKAPPAPPSAIKGIAQASTPMPAFKPAARANESWLE